MAFGRAIARILLALCLVLSIADCRREERKLGQSGAPLVMVLSPAHGANKARVGELEGLMKKESGLEVELRVAPDSESAVRMAGSPNTDAALLTLFDYLFCRQLYGANARLRVVRKGGSETHHGEIVVRADGPAHALGDLQGKKFGYVDHYSSTGYVLPAKLLLDAHVSVDSVFTGSHEASLQQLASGKVLAIGTYAGVASGHPELRAIAVTPEIPNEPVFFRPGLQADKREKIVSALEHIAQDENGKRVLVGIADIEGFKATDDAAYDSARALIDSIGRSVRDLVPSGWVVSHEKEAKPEDLAP